VLTHDNTTCIAAREAAFSSVEMPRTGDEPDTERGHSASILPEPLVGFDTSGVSGPEAAQQFPDAASRFVRAIDENQSIFIQAIGERELLSTLAIEDRAQLRVPVLFEAEKN
jgi:hypothetical protein